ncbi:MAG: hypothetical protein ABEJ74_02730 [Haloferacaceae archaeon]
MAIQKPPAVIAQARFEVLVGRDGPGDLVDGVRRLLERAPGVEAVADLRVRNVRPGLNDVRLDAEARVRVRPDDGGVDPADPEALAAQLVDGFGVREVTVRGVDADGE